MKGCNENVKVAEDGLGWGNKDLGTPSPPVGAVIHLSEGKGRCAG